MAITSNMVCFERWVIYPPLFFLINLTYKIQSTQNFNYYQTPVSYTHRGATQGAAFIPQRQFIGYSTVIADRLSSLSIRIFDGFPK